MLENSFYKIVRDASLVASGNAANSVLPEKIYSELQYIKQRSNNMLDIDFIYENCFV